MPSAMGRCPPGQLQRRMPGYQETHARRHQQVVSAGSARFDCQRQVTPGGVPAHCSTSFSYSVFVGRIAWSQTLGPPPLSICQKPQPLRLSFTLGL